MKKVVFSKALENRLKKIDSPVVNKLLESTSDQINYLGIAIKDPTQISYILNSKLEKVGNYKKWRSSVRIAAKPARAACKLVQATNAELEDFHNKFIASSKNTKLTFLKGDKIRWAYFEENYVERNHDLGESCMRYAGCQDFFGLYCENIDHVRLAVILENKKVAARCLIWYPNSINDKSIVYFDRIYAYSSEIEMNMYDALKAKGFIQISRRNIIKPENIPLIEIKLPYLNFDYYPYVDTLCYITNYNINNYGDGIVLNNTDGTRDGEYTCNYCGDNTDDLNRIGVGNQEGLCFCHDCCTFSDTYGEYVANDESYYCEYTNDTVLLKDTIILYNGDRCYEENDKLLMDIDGNYFISDDDNFVEIDGGYYRKNSSLIDYIDDTWYLIDSEEYQNIKNAELEEV